MNRSLLSRLLGTQPTPQWTTINLNNRIRVQLDRTGIEILRQAHPEGLVMTNGVWETQVWRFVEIFGGVQYPGCYAPYSMVAQLEV